LPRWTQSPREELANTISHGIGLVAALIATPVLLLAALDAREVASVGGTRF
jgi:hemolysin III